MITANDYNRAMDGRRVFRPTLVVCLLIMVFALFTASAGLSNRNRVLAQDHKDRTLAELIEQSPDFPSTSTLIMASRSSSPSQRKC